MYWTTPLLLVCLIASQVCCDDGQYVYVTGEVQYIKCISNPVNDICPVDHKVPDTVHNREWINRTVISQDLNSTSAPLRSANGSESCITANNMFQCSQILFTCKDEESYVYIDSERAYRMCRAARNECMGIGEVIRDRLFNCSTYRSATKRYSKGVTCNEYQKVENDTCPVRNYKVPSNVDYQNAVDTHERAQYLLKQNNVGKNCTNDVLQTICDITHPACTSNEKYTVSLVNRQQCLEIMKCVESANNANLTARAMSLCTKLPENTAKNFSRGVLDDPMTTPTPTPSTTNTSTTQITTTPTPCGASRMSAMSHVLVVFLVWFFLDSFAK